MLRFPMTSGQPQRNLPRDGVAVDANGLQIVKVRGEVT